jgi:uncharacterized protein (TIGR01777 family)
MPLARNWDLPQLAEADAIIHLAGEPIFGRWTARKKASIRDSRVLGTRRLSQAIRATPSIRHLICASAVGYYGDCGSQILTEDAFGGGDVLATVCRDWEAEAAQAKVRVVSLRLGIVLSENGGALKKMVPVFSRGLGGRLGSGQQWMSWIHIRDAVELFVYALENPAITGPINAVAPNPVTNAEFSRLLAEQFGKKLFWPVPKTFLHLAAGEISDALLASQRASAEKIQRLGFQFQFPELTSAFNAFTWSRG